MNSFDGSSEKNLATHALGGFFFAIGLFQKVSNWGGRLRIFFSEKHWNF